MDPRSGISLHDDDDDDHHHDNDADDVVFITSSRPHVSFQIIIP